jgi:Domain of unknown function (DUF2382)
VENPVEEQVTLQGEKITIDRRPVTGGQPVAEFTDKTIEMTETNEEAVVSKTARVTEEVTAQSKRQIASRRKRIPCVSGHSHFPCFLAPRDGPTWPLRAPMRRLSSAISGTTL